MNCIVIIGGGPSGLAAAMEATRHGARAVVIEKLDRPGGLARTIEHNGSRWDIGPHRFFTTNVEVRDLFMDVLAEDTVSVPRLTRILYGGKYFDYPLTPLNALFGLGVGNSIAIMASYLKARLRHVVSPPRLETFEDWIVDRFGERLYRVFFKTYTEKVWGIPCNHIGAEWAAQRIKGLSLTTAVMNAVRKPKRQIKTLVDEFMYPRLGAGQLYEKMMAAVRPAGAEVILNERVVAIQRDGARVTGVGLQSDSGMRWVRGDFYLCSAPLSEMLEMIDPPPPDDVMASCHSLRYRNHIGVNLTVRGTPFPDNWIYVHAPEVRMARIANYRNFSPAMAASADVSPLTIEYFCFPDEDLWMASDDELVALATKELSRLSIVQPSQVIDGFVVRSERAYPVIERGYEEHIARIRAWLSELNNLLAIGRSGMFKYNNQDHAMATGLLATRTALGIGDFDPWNVNIDAVYHESGEALAARAES